MSSKKQSSITLKQKLEIIEALKTKKQSDIAILFKCHQSVVSRIAKAKDSILSDSAGNSNLNRKRKRESTYTSIDDSVYLWLTQKQSQNVPINGPMIMQKANDFARDLHIDFEANTGWLTRFKQRRNITYRKQEGERASADHHGANDWIEHSLPNIVDGYEEKNIFNADETGLLYRALPNGTFVTSGYKPIGDKLSKERLTLLLICNQNGSEKYSYVVGKSENPRAFKRLNKRPPPMPYFANNNAWMTNKIWSKILFDLDQKMCAESRNIILFADNASCHKIDIPLKNVKLTFMPPNTTSLIQPLDQGIIRNAKVHYRTQIVRRLLEAVDNDQTVQEFAKSVDVLDALFMAKRAWWLVTPQTIQNCFKKAGFQIGTNVDDDESNLDIVLPEIDLPASVSVDDFNAIVDCDADLPCYGELTDAEIISQVAPTAQVNDENEIDVDDDTADTAKKATTRIEMLSALSVLRSYVQENSSNNQSYPSFYILENELHSDINDHLSQSKITNFFKQS